MGANLAEECAHTALAAPLPAFCPGGPVQQSLSVVLGPAFVFQLVTEERTKAAAAARPY